MPVKYYHFATECKQGCYERIFGIIYSMTWLFSKRTFMLTLVVEQLLTLFWPQFSLLYQHNEDTMSLCFPFILFIAYFLIITDSLRPQCLVHWEPIIPQLRISASLASSSDCKISRYFVIFFPVSRNLLLCNVIFTIFTEIY